MRVLWFGYDIKEAIDAPRFHHQLIPMAVQYEYGNLDVSRLLKASFFCFTSVIIHIITTIMQLIVKGLRAKGHHTMRYRERGSIICAIAQNASGIYANADFRKGGDVAGF